MTEDPRIAYAAKEIATHHAAIGLPARAYKDRIFRMIFKEKKKLLELYNAINGTNYTNEDDLTVTTLENSIYLGMKNDVSFLLYTQLTLYEHQSTKNPNIPLRDLLYVANIYSNLTKDENLYGSAIVKIPEPHFVVFYNGSAKMEECQELRLSDMYEKKCDDPDLELKVKVLNINSGYNNELLERCQTLREYMILVERIRSYSQTMTFAKAVECAVDECIRENILKEFLQKNRSEVISVSIFEYDEERHMRQIAEEGRTLGEERINHLNRRLIEDNRMEDLRHSIEDKEYQEQLLEEYGL